MKKIKKGGTIENAVAYEWQNSGQRAIFLCCRRMSAMVPIKRFGGVESADTNGRQVLIAEPEKILPVVRTVPETVCLPVLMTLHRGFRRSRQNGRRKIIP